MSFLTKTSRMWFNSSSLVEAKAEVPMYNESFPSVYQGLVNRPSAYADIDKWIEVTPEAIAIISAMKTDMKPYSYKFIGPEYKIKKAVSFCDENNFAEELDKVYWDWILYGDGYLWKGILSNNQRVVAMTNAFSKANAVNYIARGKSYSLDEVNPFEIKADEDEIKNVKHVPSDTMNIDHDKRKIIRFRQKVGIDENIWNPEQIIHGKLITMKGKVYGFSPTQACLTEMNTIGYIKDYAGTFFKKGGVPDWMFILPKEIAGSNNHKRLIQELQKYKHPLEKHGNYVFCGEVEPTKLNDFNKDMEFRQLAIYLTGVLALAFNMPMSRVAAIIGGEIKVSAGSDDLSNEGYWNKIDEMQTYWERLLNNQLFEKYFGVQIRFDRGYKQNEIREVQRMVQAGEGVNKINLLLATFDKKVSLTYVKNMFYLEDGDLEEGKIEMFQPLGTKEPMPNKKLEGGYAREAYSEQKKKEVNPNQKQDGV